MLSSVIFKFGGFVLFILGGVFWYAVGFGLRSAIDLLG